MEVLDSLFGAVRRCCDVFPDKRTGTNGSYAMADIGMAAFSLFFTQSPSFLAFQRRFEEGHGRSNCETLFGMSRIPTDNHIRAMLDPVAPDHLFPAFGEAVAALEPSGGIAAFERLGSHVLIALDGTEYYRSTKIHCRHCSTRTRKGRKGQVTEYFHTMLCATIVARAPRRGPRARGGARPWGWGSNGPKAAHNRRAWGRRAGRRGRGRHGARYQ